MNTSFSPFFYSPKVIAFCSDSDMFRLSDWGGGGGGGGNFWRKSWVRWSGNGGPLVGSPGRDVVTNSTEYR